MDASRSLHPIDQALSAYGVGKLDDHLAESVSRHLESCSECRRRVAELTSENLLGRVRAAQGPPDSPPSVGSSFARTTSVVERAGSRAPPPTDSLPSGLAGHPDYKVISELGRGGIGVAYLVQNTLLDRKEVLKVVGNYLLAGIRNAARLHHPNIVNAYSAFQLGENLVLAMEYVEGLSLAKLVKIKGPLPIIHACYFVQRAALGLQHGHEHGMVHGDIKPGNLMLARVENRAVVKILDFGLANVQSEGAVDKGLTHEGPMLDTPDYMAPEQISDAGRADIRADIYSLGCTLYYLLTGGPPYQGQSLYEMLEAHHSMEATPLNLVRPDAPVELAVMVAKMMAKEPERRFQEPKEVAQALNRFINFGANQASDPRAEVARVGA